MNKIITSILFTVVSFSSAFASRGEVIDSLDNFINRAIADRYFPGAQLVIGDSEGVIYSKSYGYLDYNRSNAVDSTTLYDLASCTKVLATTLGVMTLIDEGKLSLETSIGEVVDVADTLQFKDVTVAELLYHNSGFLPGVSIGPSLIRTTDEEIPVFAHRKSATNPYIYDNYYYAAKDIIYDSVYISRHKGENQVAITNNLFLNKNYHVKLDSMVSAAYRPKLRGVHKYSDLNFYMLKKIVEKRAGSTLDSVVENIYDKMRLSNIGFKPLEWSPVDRISPTEYDVLLRRDTLRGFVHDELACVEGGVGGNAGLFGSANSVAQICNMFLRGGLDVYGDRIIKSETLKEFTKIHRSKSGSTFGLGFTKIDSNKLPYPPQSYGHTGYTGTFLWIDPTKDLYLVLLTNRVYPTRTNRKFDSKYRAQVWEYATRIR